MKATARDTTRPLDKPLWRNAVTLFVAVTMALYILACLSNVYRFAQPPPEQIPAPPISGFQVLLIGWLGLFVVLMEAFQGFGGVNVGLIAWYANLPFFAGLIFFLCGRFQISRWLALAAVVIGSTSLLVQGYPFSNPHGWTDRPIIGYGIGFYAWLGSLLILTVGAFGFQCFVTARRTQLAWPVAAGKPPD